MKQHSSRHRTAWRRDFSSILIKSETERKLDPVRNVSLRRAFVWFQLPQIISPESPTKRAASGKFAGFLISRTSTAECKTTISGSHCVDFEYALRWAGNTSPTLTPGGNFLNYCFSTGFCNWMILLLLMTGIKKRTDKNAIRASFFNAWTLLSVCGGGMCLPSTASAQDICYGSPHEEPFKCSHMVNSVFA